MVGKRRSVIWDREAVLQFSEIIEYISSESPKGANKVKQEVLKNTRLLSENPEAFSIDRFKKNNDGSYRAFTVFHYRIAYRITNDLVKILRIRHTGREPLEIVDNAD